MAKRDIERPTEDTAVAQIEEEAKSYYIPTCILIRAYCLLTRLGVGANLDTLEWAIDQIPNEEEGWLSDEIL